MTYDNKIIEQWVDDDKHLHNLQVESQLTKQEFVLKYRHSIDAAISASKGGRKPARYLSYQDGMGKK